ncbi:F0F1 ATP synthase subunit alpha [Candidatus Woesebacteria bacterium]|nr:F0F1 ATP synthase subunit alpha [Candidatus Woesebacteria bacterium]
MNNISSRTLAVSSHETGKIISFFSGVAKISGLPHVFLHEVLLDPDGNPAAIVIGFDKQFVEALFFDETVDLQKPLSRSKRVFSIPISESVVGRVFDGLGTPRDFLGDIVGKRIPVFRSAPQIIDRQPVIRPLTTGVKIIDSVLSLGRGQRELIIGDRKLGKSTLALDTVLNQKHEALPVYCVYVLCGQKEQQLKEIAGLFEKNNAFLYTVIVAATAESSYASQYVAPFVGCAIGEYFRDAGKDALVVYDDLSKHANAYRSIALLLGRPPGRESYPGDIFSLHAALLERAGQLSKKQGGGSLTALPIVETQEGDITSFISTNIISITDGQIYVERGLFQKGFLPAVNVGLSVSRVGSQSQPSALRSVVGGIRLALSQHKELQKLTQLETTVSEQAKTKIHRGELMLELLKQEKHTNISWPEQVVLFYAVEEGFFDTMEKEQWSNFEDKLRALMRNRYAEVLQHIARDTFDKTVTNNIQQIVEDAKNEFIATQP